MALSLSNFLYALILASSGLFQVALAKTNYYDWNVGWVNRNPDGLLERPVIAINGQWPLPVVNITKGDRVVIEVHNKLGNQSTSMHWHGLFQNGTNDMDGPVGVTQCNIPPGHSMTYNFTIDQPGTYWYHSHTYGQYPDGWRGQFVVNDPENPFIGQFDEEVALTVSDWYHDQMTPLIEAFINVDNPTGAEPIPNSALMNDTQNLTFPVVPGRTYFFRLSNIGAFAGQYFWIEGHEMTIIEIDGVYTDPQKVDMFYIAVAQRYGFLVTMKDDASTNYAMTAHMDESLFDVVPPTLMDNSTGYLVYNKNAPLKPAPPKPSPLEPYDDTNLRAYDGLKTFENVDKRITLNMVFNDLGNGASYAFFNDISYTAPVVPTLYSVLSTGEAANNVSVYGDYTNAHVLNKGDVVEIVLNNHDTGKHPFHLHGHNFQLVHRSRPDAGDYDPATEHDFPTVPARRDTFMTYPLSNFVIRFVADNPGVWFFHCHIDWHLVTGLAAVMIEAPLDLQKTLTVPQAHYDNCEAANTPYKGNAAGNTEDVYDLKGQNKEVTPLPSGFTARGIVALVFSAICAVCGMAVIVWYGAAPIGTAEAQSTQHFIEKLQSTSS